MGLVMELENDHQREAGDEAIGEPPKSASLARPLKRGFSRGCRIHLELSVHPSRRRINEHAGAGTHQAHHKPQPTR